jgi:DNA-binding NarL/FixJ family response regulator
MATQLKSVLIVDDNFNIRGALRAFLERSLGMEVCDSARDGSEAIKKAKEQKPDLVLMDLSMPLMNGLEAATAIRKALPDTRIVVFTLYSDTLGKLLAKAAGVDLVVSKSDGTAGLLHALSSLLTQPSRSAEAGDQALNPVT